MYASQNLHLILSQSQSIRVLQVVSLTPQDLSQVKTHHALLLKVFLLELSQRLNSIIPENANSLVKIIPSNGSSCANTAFPP